MIVIYETFMWGGVQHTRIIRRYLDDAGSRRNVDIDLTSRFVTSYWAVPGTLIDD